MSVVSLSHASLKQSNNDVDIDDDTDTPSSTARAFSLKRQIIIPSSLSPPRDSGVSTSESVNYGSLGGLLLMHGQFLIFESFAPIPRTNVGDNAPIIQYVGIEILDWMNPDTIANTTLLVYPGPEVCMNKWYSELLAHIFLRSERLSMHTSKKAHDMSSWYGRTA